MLEDARDIHACRRDLHFAFEKADALPQILDGDDLQPVHHGRFGRVVFGHQHADFAVGFGAQRDGQDAFDRADSAGEGKFAHHQEVLELIGNKLLAGSEHPNGDRKVKAGALLPHIRRREIDRRAAHRKLEAGVR